MKYYNAVPIWELTQYLVFLSTSLSLMDPRKGSLNGQMALLTTTVTGTGASLVMASIQTQKKTVCRCGTGPAAVGTLDLNSLRAAREAP